MVKNIACKKSFSTHSTIGVRCNFIKGETYIWYETNRGSRKYVVNEFGDCPINFNLPDFYDLFYTEEEMRDIKIMTILAEQ